MKILMYAQITVSCIGRKKDDDFCTACKASRWKDKDPESVLTRMVRRKSTPCKVLRYFPVKERLKRLFNTSHRVA
jgi:hypothetical protein